MSQRVKMMTFKAGSLYSGISNRLYLSLAKSSTFVYHLVLMLWKHMANLDEPERLGII